MGSSDCGVVDIATKQVVWHTIERAAWWRSSPWYRCRYWAQKTRPPHPTSKDYSPFLMKIHGLVFPINPVPCLVQLSCHVRGSLSKLSIPCACRTVSWQQYSAPAQLALHTIEPSRDLHQRCSKLGRIKQIHIDQPPSCSPSPCWRAVTWPGQRRWCRPRWYTPPCRPAGRRQDCYCPSER